MMRAFRVIALAVAAIACRAATFESADVHQADPASPWAVAAMREPTLSARGGQIRGGRYEIRAATLVDLISVARSIDPVKLIGGPAWLDTARFDVIAKVPADATAADLPAMLQALLADRFHLATHPDIRPFPEMVLTAGPHPLMKNTAGAESGCKRNAPSAEAGIDCRDVTMAQFAQELPRIAADYFMGNRLLDQTGLNGAYDFELHWTRRNKVAAPATGAVSLATAVGKQLGLSLTVGDIPQPVLVVDKVDETPTANAPEVAQLLPSEPLVFEVAVIKPSAPGAKKNVRLNYGGGIEIQSVTLKSLIKLAWDIEELDAIDNEELLIGAPGFSESARYDITARAPATGPADIDALKLMLRALLADRFGLRTHVEMRTVSVLALVASKPRLQSAAPRSRSGCSGVPAPQGEQVFSVRCRNTTMAQLAPKLQPFGGPYVPRPVIDATGLKGAFDFTLTWSPPHLVAQSTSDQSTSEPNGGITIVEALEKQLGIKLRPQKSAMPVLVIDALNATPTEN